MSTPYRSARYIDFARPLRTRKGRLVKVTRPPFVDAPLCEDAMAAKVSILGPCGWTEHTYGVDGVAVCKLLSKRRDFDLCYNDSPHGEAEADAVRHAAACGAAEEASAGGRRD